MRRRRLEHGGVDGENSVLYIYIFLFIVINIYIYIFIFIYLFSSDKWDSYGDTLCLFNIATENP